MEEAQKKLPLFSPGLEGIPVCKSGVGFVDGKNGILEYRGIRIEDLAEKSTFEEVTYLLLKAALPNAQELKDFDWELRRHRRAKPKVIDIIRALPSDGHPMNALQTSVAALGMFHPTKDVYSEKDVWHSICRLIAKMPTLVALFHRIRNGEDPITPNDDLPFAANFLYMLTGNVPSDRDAKLFDACLILHAEHTLNASTFSARVTGSTLADPFSVITAAVGTLSGSLHGGANERVVEMLHKIGSVDQVRAYMEDKIAKKEKVMGLGHRVYKTKDPRAVILQNMAKDLFVEKRGGKLMDIAEELEKIAGEKFSKKGIYPNVDFYSGIVYKQLGIAEDLYTPIFAVARTSGWLAHWLDQVATNRIYRPTQIYEGQHATPYVPVDQR